MTEAVVCASCPETYHDRVAELCLQHQIQKAFGKAGDMLNKLSGKGWIPKWEAKVVMATVTKAQTLNTNKALILCIAGGKNCDAEMARQPALVRAIKTEMASQEFRVRVELIEIHEFLERYPDVTSKTSKSTKENGKPKYGKGGKDTQDGKGKDHQSSLPSRSRPQQAKFIRSDHRSRSRSPRNAIISPPPNTVYANTIGTPPLPAPPSRRSAAINKAPPPPRPSTPWGNRPPSGMTPPASAKGVRPRPKGQVIPPPKSQPQNRPPSPLLHPTPLPFAPSHLPLPPGPSIYEKGLAKGQHKGPQKGKSQGKGVSPPPVLAPPASLHPPPRHP